MQPGGSRDCELYRREGGTHIGRPSTNIDRRAPDVLDHPRVDEPTRTESCSAMHEGITTALGALPSWLRRTLTTPRQRSSQRRSWPAVNGVRRGDPRILFR